MEGVKALEIQIASSHHVERASLPQKCVENIDSQRGQRYVLGCEWRGPDTIRWTTVTDGLRPVMKEQVSVGAIS
jgi:hypothetical protein